MGWGFRRSTKIAPDIRINPSKGGVSTSIGGKGFTYNTRGRLTVSVPGTGLRFSKNLNSRKTAPSEFARSGSTASGTAVTEFLCNAGTRTRRFALEEMARSRSFEVQ
ncbi:MULTISPECIES: DUF4236 domain-containing protein [unclassified Caballeronia]|uniref:DUF4236 domain-containing protein n=1 Tax=unclassified Caballeronia TaxID=2646786 RepID=UPI00285AB1DF|nr:MULTISPECIES: DUF4236 domain-containing protein [unclassified Caballeronia]MDR5750204.1 DUF4236 domain-containing protein [Caballeronia sp. LZ024]MDR5842667.1 DUF4236 domain-containing protein [Caballeronia sp. LZ031]